jgi:hypothetical protein
VFTIYPLADGNPLSGKASQVLITRRVTVSPDERLVAYRLSDPASLILGKVYRMLPDAEAEAHNMPRIIDEDTSEPDGYLYPSAMFAPIELPEVARRVLMAAGD